MNDDAEKSILPFCALPSLLELCADDFLSLTLALFVGEILQAKDDLKQLVR